MDVRGYGDFPRALATPNDIDLNNWRKSIKYFQKDEHKIVLARNKKLCELETSVNRGGSSSYSSTCNKKVTYDICNCLFKI